MIPIRDGKVLVIGGRVVTSEQCCCLLTCADFLDEITILYRECEAALTETCSPATCPEGEDLIGKSLVAQAIVTISQLPPPPDPLPVFPPFEPYVYWPFLPVQVKLWGRKGFVDGEFNPVVCSEPIVLDDGTWEEIDPGTQRFLPGSPSTWVIDRAEECNAGCNEGLYTCLVAEYLDATLTGPGGSFEATGISRAVCLIGGLGDTIICTGDSSSSGSV